MKKILQLLTLIINISIFSQCQINGKEILKNPTSSTYSINQPVAQCADCHQWTILGKSAIIDGDYKKNSVKIKPISDGNVTLTLTYLSTEGVEQCSKLIELTNNSTKSTDDYQDVPCNIESMKFSEVKYTEGKVIIIPDNTDTQSMYTWIASYANDTKKESKERLPQFLYEKANPIKTIELIISEKNCVRMNTKTYESGFWE